ncbi:MAG: hypothetical protein IK082_12375 [Oscillospiraceae bacterium]|nr:hypothetical protein [Oscillospiraceae bacterium]
MNEERIVTGYCRKLDGSRVLCLELEDGEWRTDCLYPDCEFAGTCRLMETVRTETESRDGRHRS